MMDRGESRSSRAGIRGGGWLVLFVVAAMTAAPATPAQDLAVTRLVESVWGRGAEAALDLYSALPNSERQASLLVSAADQLLWMGKPVEAARLLARAEADAPDLTEARFQLGRAALQRAETAQALQAFRAGLGVIDRDTSLTEQSRVTLRRRLENRVELLSRSDELLARTGGYRLPDGRVYIFKFDPYLNTFPALLDLSTGSVRILYPAGGSVLEWRDEEEHPLGSVRFEGQERNRGVLVIRTNDGESLAVSLGITQETLRFRSGSASIEGTLFRPPTRERVPGIVLTHGAGLSRRYNLTLEALAFASAGVAAFVFDKPGLGKSTGGNWLLLSIEEQVDDLTRAVASLRGRPDMGRIGVWGFSQGGWVAPIAAARSKEIAFVVMVSGASVGPQEQYAQALTMRLRKAGISDELVQEAGRHLQAVWARVNAGARLTDLGGLYATAATKPWGAQFPKLSFQWELDWWRKNEMDPAAVLASLRIPVLAIYGGNDETVPPGGNVPLLARYLAASNAGDYTITVLSGANHQLMTGDHYQPRYFPSMVDWVSSHAREGSEADRR